MQRRQINTLIFKTLLALIGCGPRQQIDKMLANIATAEPSSAQVPKWSHSASFQHIL